MSWVAIRKSFSIYGRSEDLTVLSHLLVRVNTMRLIKCILLLLFFIAPICRPVSADDLELQFAGFAFRGDHAHITQNYPRVFAIAQEMGEGHQPVIDRALAEKIKAMHLKKGKIVSQELAMLSDGSLTLACCLDTELVSVEQHDDGYKLVIDLGAQALLFDYDSMSVVASFPIMVELIDYLSTAPDESIIIDRIKALLLTDKYGVNLLDDFVAVMKEVEIKKHYGGTIKVTDVIVEDKARQYLPAHFKQDESVFQNFVAQNFGKFLSMNQGVSILPYTKGSDIGGKMAIRCSDAKVFELSIPEPQFSVELTVRGFKKVCTDQKASGSCWVYGSFMNIKVEQPVLGKIYLDESLKHGVSKTVPTTQKTIQDWPSFQNSMVALLNATTNEFAYERKYEPVRKVIEKCR